jgi:UDP-glucose 6-dehydrogenase
VLFYSRRFGLKISLIGAGYVGLVTSGCLAEIGHEVVRTDSDAAILETLESGRLPIYEPGLDAVIAKTRKEGRLRFCARPGDPYSLVSRPTNSLKKSRRASR